MRQIKDYIKNGLSDKTKENRDNDNRLYLNTDENIAMEKLGFKILKEKIRYDGLEKYKISDSVLEYIVNQVPTNIVMQKGILNKVIAIFILENREKIGMELVEEVVKSIENA